MATPNSSMAAGHEATLANWRDASHNRWAFRNVEKLMPVAPVPRDASTPHALPERFRSMEGFSLTLPSGGALDMPSFLKATATDAMVVLKDGELVFEYYADGNGEHVPHILMSATKSVIGLIVGILAAQDGIGIEVAVSSYVPEVAGGPFANASMRNLLDMRTGIMFDEAQQRAYEAATGWEPGSPGNGLLAFFSSLDGPAATHGGPFHYVSANTDLLGIAVERATGRRIAELASELLWRPLGATDDAAITLDPDGMARCTGGFCATARDLARVGQLVLDNGSGVVPTGWLSDVASNGDRDAWARGDWGQAFAAISPNLSYRSGWYVTGDAAGTLFAMGVHGQNLFVDPTNNIVVAKLSSQAESSDYRAIGLTHMAVAQLRRYLSDVGTSAA